LDTGTLAQSFINGLMAGWIYVLVALGLTLILSIVGIIQLAHGEIYMLGGYGAYLLCVGAGLNFFLALVITAFLVALLGIVIERYLFRPFRGGVLEHTVIMAVALLLLLRTSAVIAFGGTTRAIPNPFPGALTIAGVTLSNQRLIAILLSIVLVSALFLFIRRTRIGQAMLAVSQDLDTAALQGINADRICSLAMFLGCFMAAAAGALMAVVLALSPFMGDFALMKGIAVIVLGGLGSIPGAVIGGLILGLIDGMVPPLLNAHLASTIGFVAVILILVLRPQGLLGHESR
jgi:branched-chain amino acid transport system permease protein